MIIQIYEIQTPVEAESILALGVDHIGSVLLAKRPMQDFRLKSTIEAVQSANRKSCLIPLFSEVETIARAIDYYRPDILHLCDALPIENDREGELTCIIERQTELRELFPQIEFMRSIPIAIRGSAHRVPSLALARAFESVSDWFLTDTWLLSEGQSVGQDQPVRGYVGITGQTCDWEIARQMVRSCRVPIILAGGISPSNAHAGIVQVQPAGVDSCTQTNAVDPRGQSIRFRKDPERVKALVAAAREAAHRLEV